MVTATQPRYQNDIGGELADAVEGAEREVLAPTTGSQVARVPEGTQADVDRAVAAAARAFETWGQTTPADRATALLGLAARLEAHSEELAQLELMVKLGD